MSNQGKTVLIVDDSIAVRQHVSLALRGAGFEIMLAVDGIEGAEMIDVTPGLALVICDINMPNLNGIDMLVRVKSKPENKALQVLMLTTEAQTSLVKRAKELGAVGWIVKPFKSVQLVQAVEHLTRTP
ncbi:MAG TPA: response regulator [Bryobacteraceae bacterium]|jgi:two-component system chemotaxis response regulator CheY